MKVKSSQLEYVHCHWNHHINMFSKQDQDIVINNCQWCVAKTCSWCGICPKWVPNDRDPHLQLPWCWNRDYLRATGFVSTVCVFWMRSHWQEWSSEWFWKLPWPPQETKEWSEWSNLYNIWLKNSPWPPPETKSSQGRQSSLWSCISRGPTPCSLSECWSRPWTQHRST